MLWLDEKQVFAMVYHRLKSSFVLFLFFCIFLEGGNIEDVVKERIKFINSQSQHSVTNGITLFGNYIYTLVSQIKEPGSLICVNLVM